MRTDKTLSGKYSERRADKYNINPKCHFNVLIIIIKMGKMERTRFQRCEFSWVPGMWILETVGYHSAGISDQAAWRVISQASTLFISH